jgi:hypothetical protein
MIGALLVVQLMAAATPGEIQNITRLKACIAKIEAKPDDAFEDASAWANETHSRHAYNCKAQALIALKRVPEGASLLEGLAGSADGGGNGDRAALYSQAGNARLLDLDPDQAIVDFSEGLKYTAGAPDLLIDRARAYALISEWRKAEEDLSAALDKKPGDSFILRLRAEARLQLAVFDLAEKDAEDAVRADPRNVDALLERGRVREAKRSGKKPD